MSDNKFIQRLKGKQTPKSVVEVKNDKLVAPFTGVPNSTDVVGAIIDDKDSSAVVAKGAQNWKLDGNSLVVASSLSGDGADYTSEFNASGSGLWINATYSLPAAIFNAGTKWVLKLCGKNLLTTSGETIGFTLVVKVGNTHITSKAFTVAEGANVFCRQLVIDFSESEQAVIKAQNGDSLTVQLLCADANASATIYNGMTVLTALQRRVDSDAVASNTSTFDDLETRLDNIETELGDTFVKTDGTSIMSAPLKFMSGSVRGAVGPYFNGVGFWKMSAQGVLTQIAALSDSQFIPTTTNATDLGSSTKGWKDLYLSGTAYVATINNGTDIMVPDYGGTMVVADFKPAEEGQMLLLDNKLQPYWAFASTYLKYPKSWTTDSTTQKFCDDIAADDTAVVGKAYLGEVKINDLPAGIGNAEVEVKIMDGRTFADKVIVLTLTSGNVSPYMWVYTYWDGGSNISGWQTWQEPLVSGTNIKTINNTSMLGSGNITVDSLPNQTGHSGEYLTTDGSNASWTAINTGSNYHPDLFDFKWSDHIVNDVQWLRADTFSWQSGSVYEAAYWELFYDIQISTYWYLANVGPAYTKSRTPAVGDAVYLNSNLTTQIGTVATYDDVNDAITVGANTYTFMSNTYVTPTTETVAGHTVTVYTGTSGRKIVGQVNEYDVSLIYNDTGVAWYYVIDLNNKRFKLPRTKFGFTGLRDTVGNYVAPGLPNITGEIGAGGSAASQNVQSGAFYNIVSLKSKTRGAAEDSEYFCAEVGFDASLSSAIYQNDATVQPAATQMYLYFYVGEFTQSAVENTAGLNASLFNGKVDLDAQNFDSAGKSYLAGIGMPSDTYDDLTLGASGATYAAPENGWFTLNKLTNSTGQYGNLVNETNGINITNQQSASGSNVRVFLPAKKGDVVKCSYSAGGTLQWFRFVYAKGEI